MEKEFCNYNQSLQLKLIGFDEPCLARHAIITEWENPTGEVKFQMIDCLKSDKNLIKAPLKQQAFRWFREKHDIQTLIKKNKSDHVWYRYEVYFERLATGENPPVMVGHTINSWLGLNLEFNTYEEAKDACLDKLIEIVKNK